MSGKTVKLPDEVVAKQKKVGRLGRLKRVDSMCSLVLSEITKPTDVDDVLFDYLSEKTDLMSVQKFWNVISCTGVLEDDPRLKDTYHKLIGAKQRLGLHHDSEADFKIDRDTFKDSVHDNIYMVGKVFKNELVVQEFNDFAVKVEDIFEETKDVPVGTSCTDYPQLARVDPNLFAVSLCTIDGQRASFGDSDVPFTMQGLGKPLNYAVAVTELGPKRVHDFVGQEPSGRGTAALSVDKNRQPHNPMINSGGIVVTTLLKPKLEWADRFDFIFGKYKSLAGGDYVGFNNPAYLAAKGKSDRNFALAYYMRENKCFTPGVNLLKELEFFFQLSSVDVTTASMSVMAATLANGGICPITGEVCLSNEAVRNTLSLMYSCGLYDHSGQFAFTVGLPAKSGRSGGIMIVVPNVVGFCVYSPGIDDMGISERGVEFCRGIERVFNFHNYDPDDSSLKIDPTKTKSKRLNKASADCVVALLFGAALGDIKVVRKYVLSGMDMNRADYDGRTALHLAAAEGQLQIVKMLLEQCNASIDPKDRWDQTPLDDAQKHNQLEVVSYLKNYKPKQDSVRRL